MHKNDQTLIFDIAEIHFTGDKYAKNLQKFLVRPKMRWVVLIHTCRKRFKPIDLNKFSQYLSDF